MTWLPGQSGNPRGIKRDKFITQAIIVALQRATLTEDGKPTKQLTMMAERLVEKAVAGDLVAIKEVIDRVEGKPLQEQELGGTLSLTIGLVRHYSAEQLEAEALPAPALEQRGETAN